MPRMLIIDDNAEFKTMVSCYFTDLGFKVLLAENGRDGLTQAQSFRPDVIVLDVMMPDIGGIEVLRELQTDDDLRSVPVLVMTGTYFDGKMSDLFKQEPNCREFLSKTADIDWVGRRVQELIKPA